MNDAAFSRQQMIEQQLRAWEVFDPRVLCAFDELPREQFVPERYRRLAFADTAIPLGHDESMMTPQVEGRMLQALGVQPGERVLEVGTGSGWITALLAHLGGEVTSIDIVAEFTATARTRLAAVGLAATLETRDAATLEADAFDVIAVTGSVPVYAPRFDSLFKSGGRLFVVVGEGPAMAATLVTRDAHGAVARESLFETGLKALRHFPPPNRFTL